MGASKVAGRIVEGCIALVAIALLIKVVWSSTIPDLFPGAVEQGLVAKSISWMAAGAIATFIAVVSAIVRGQRLYRKE